MMSSPMTTTSGAQGKRDDNAVDHFLDEEDVMNHADAEIQTSRWKHQNKIVLAAAFVSLVAIVIGVATLGSKWTTVAPLQSNNGNAAHSRLPKTIDDLPPQVSHQEHPTPASSDESTTTTPSLVATSSNSRPPPDQEEDVCFSDRFDNEHMSQNNQLFPGQFICSHQNGERRYRFGLTKKNSRLVLQDMESNITLKVYFQPKQKRTKELFFTLAVDGTFVVHNKTTSNKAEIVWKQKPHYNMSLYDQCLSDHDCPYLHLHADGVLVLNWIDFEESNGDWMQKNVKKVYGFQ